MAEADVPVYKPSPFMKAAAQIIEASEGHVPDDLNWDPLTMSYGGGSGLPGDAIELPTELMMNLVGPGLAARHAKPTQEVPLAPSQERARKRLQQRKEAAAREAAEKAAQQEKEVEEPLDESWIDQLEQKDAKKKANREKAVQIRNARKKALKAHAAAKQEALESAEVQEEEVEQAEPEPVKPPEPEDEEDDMQPVEQSKQRRKRQARQAAKQREEEEQARREEERKREEEQRLEAERKQQEAEKARKERLEQERLEQERKRLEELREAERRRKEEELWIRREAEKQEAERRDAEKKEAERKRQEEVRERREQKLKERLEREKEQKEQREKEQKEREQREQREQKEREQTRARKLREEEDDKEQAAEEARVDGDRRRKGEPRESDQRARQGRKQDKDDVKENGEQPTQVKSLRQTLTPSQLRRQQRKRQREARRAAEAAAREEDESEEEVETKPKYAERKQNERPKKEASLRETKEETDRKAEEGKRVRGGSVSSAASLDSTACKEEDVDPSDAPRTSSELRKDAEAFPTPRSASGSFDQGRQMQEVDPLMQSVMGITTLMISQIPEQTDAESFRRHLDSWGFIGTYNFFYMPPDVSEGWGGRCVFINFIDQAMANMCMSAFQQCPSEGVATPYSVQGLEQNIGHFSQFVGAGDMVNGPLIVPTPTPSAWALNGAQAMMNTAQGKFSPQIRGQFHKTKMCAFHKKKKCTMGVACPFAHSREELNSPPDLSKTKLCVNFFKRKCNDIYCKFAHGHQELRATGSVYKTELCRAWSSGTCKAGDTCRYAHGVKELRGAQMGMGYMGYMEDDYMSVDGQMGCDVMGGLQGIWEDEAAAMQHYAGYNGTSSYPAQGSGEHRGRSAPSSGFSSGQPQDGTGDGFNDAMSDMGLSDVSTLCPGEGRLSRQQTAPPTASFLDAGNAGRSVHGNVVLRVKGTFMESVFLDEEVERLPLRRSWSDGDLPQLQVDMEGEQD